MESGRNQQISHTRNAHRSESGSYVSLTSLVTKYSIIIKTKKILKSDAKILRQLQISIILIHLLIELD